MAAAPAAAGGLALLPVRSGELHAFDLAKREVVWSYDLEGEQWTTPVVWQQYVIATSWGQRLHALSLRSGDDGWTRPLPAAVTATPAIIALSMTLVHSSGVKLCLLAMARVLSSVPSDPVGRSPRLKRQGRAYNPQMSGMFYSGQRTNLPMRSIRMPVSSKAK